MQAEGRPATEPHEEANMPKPYGTMYLVVALLILLLALVIFVCLVPALLAPDPAIVHLLTGGQP